MPQNHPRGLPRDGEEDRMDSKEITNRFIVGSPAIDRMRKEIDSVVKGILGLVIKQEQFLNYNYPSSESNLFKESSFHKVFYSPVPFLPVCEWRVFGYKAYLPNMTWQVECYLKSATGDFRAYHSFHMAGMAPTEFNYKHVQSVRESLEVFVDGMRRTFSFLEESWQPVLDAADYAEKNGW